MNLNLSWSKEDEDTKRTMASKKPDKHPEGWNIENKF
jgi:hypothetical protein